EVRRRKGMRHLRLRIGKQNQVVVSVPWHCSDREVKRFVASQRAWIFAQLAKAPPTRGLGDWFATQPRLTGSGDVYDVRIERSESARSGYRFTEGGSAIVLRVPEATED